MRNIRQYIIFVTAIIIWGCDNENAFDCVKKVGNITTYNINVAEINAVEVIGDIQLTIENSVEQSISLTTGENLYPKIDVEVIDGKLIVTDNNHCNWARSYENTVLNVKSDNITEIHNTGSRDVNSIGTYAFTGELLLSSNNTSGDYYLDVDGKYLRISTNKVSNFYLTGTLEQLTAGFFSGQGRLEGKDLNVNSVNVFHRGSNDIIIKPTQLLNGSIESYGNIVIYGTPSTVDITYNGEGKVIYK